MRSALPVRVIVLNWNGRQWLGGCLASLAALDPPAAEVVVVDNASADGTAVYVRQAFPSVQVVALDRNVGFAGGNNRGAIGASATYLAFLNNDTQVAPTWLANLVATAEADPAVGLVTSRIVYMDRPDILDSAGDGYLRCGGGFKYWHGQATAGAPGSREVFGACGAAFLIRRDLFESIGGFDEDFFMVYEDVDLSYRARLTGAICRYAADASVRHVGSASIGRVSATAVFYGQRNLEWVWIKNSPLRLLWRSSVAHALYDIAGAIGYARRGQFGAWCRAKLAAVGGLPRMLRKRRAIQRSTAVAPARLWQLMEPDWIALKRLEKRFDFGDFAAAPKS